MSDSSPRQQPVYLGDHRALTRTAHGHAIVVDTRDLRASAPLLLDGTAHPACAAALRRVVQPGMTVLEVGSGYGELTLLAGELVGDGGHVVALEPDPARARLLGDSLEANRLDGRARIDTAAGAPADLDAYVTTHALRPDVLLLAGGADPHAVIEGATGLISGAADIRVVLSASPNGEAALLEAAGLVSLESDAASAVYGPPEALPVPEPAIVALALADELFQFPGIVESFISSYAGRTATLVVLGLGWEEHALRIRLDSIGATQRLARQGLDLVAVATDEDSDTVADLAEVVDTVFTHGTVPAAFRYVMRIQPSASSRPAFSILTSDPEGPPLPLYEEQPGRLRSRLCTQEQFGTAEYASWCSRLRMTPALHRKQWEYVFICQALEERGLLGPGRRGIGFGVGSEPLPALFASLGCEIVASDLGLEEAIEAGWLNGNQHATGIHALNAKGICPPDAFNRLVSFRVEDMNDISPDLHGGFDFTWSSCCFEHLGSIEHGLRFVEESVKLLKPGGVAVHTTEFNLSSNDDTVFEGGCVIFRRRDIDRLAQRLTAAGHRISLDYSEGDGPADRHVDVPPYTQSPHLRLQLEGFVSTSIGLIVQRAA